MARSKVQDTEQYLANQSWDDQNGLPMVELAYSADGGATYRRMVINADGTLPGGGGLVTAVYDYISRTLTNSTTETYVYKTGGSGGTTVATVTVVYTDSTLATISTVTRS